MVHEDRLKGEGGGKGGSGLWSCTLPVVMLLTFIN